jgi:hypothetical protein
MPAELSPASVAANLSCLLFLARHKSEAEEEIRESARVLLACVDGREIAIDATPSWVSVNGARLPSGTPGSREVGEAFLGHGVSRIEFPADAGLTAVLPLARALAAFPGVWATWEEFLQAIGPAAQKLRLTRAGADLSVIRVHDSEPVMTAAQARERELIAKLHMKPVVDEGGLILPPIEMQPQAEAAIQRSSPDRREEARQIERLISQGRSAVDAGDYGSLLQVTADFLDAMEATPSEASARVHRLELKRLLSKHHIAQFARMAATGNQRELAIAVLRRLGSDATEILMDLLVETEAMAERRGYFSALTRMEDGTEIIIHHLDHPTWYVVRNAAELCGEMRLSKSVAKLAQHITHADERVRKSVAVSLARIGTPEVLEPLSRMLKDPSPAIRVTVLGNLEGSKSRPLAMPLAALLESEEHPDVQREILRALGRIGTPDALLALRRVANGEVRRLPKRLRLQAIESLGGVGTPGAQILRTLAGDADSEIGSAAAKALQEAMA